VVDFDRILAALVGLLIKAAAKLVALTLWGFAVRFVPCPWARFQTKHWTKQPIFLVIQSQG
jgi:hypothetical protein